TSDFTYTESGGTSTPSNGFTLTLEDDSRGALALGGGGADLGYGTDSAHPATAINNSVALEFNMNGTSQVGLALNGAAATNFVSTGSVNLASGDPIAVHVNFSASTMVVTLTDSVANKTFTTQFNSVNMPAILGSNVAFVGFTGSTGATTDALQTISGFKFSPNNAQLPAPLANTNTTPLTGFSGTTTNGITLNRADGHGLNGSASSNNTPQGVPFVSTDGNTLTLSGTTFNEAASAFFNTPVSVSNFTAKFTYQYSGGSTVPGNGITFVLESDQRNTNAIGGGGPDLGYGSDSNSPAAAISSSFGAALNIITPGQSAASQIDAGTNGGFGLLPYILNNTGPVNLASGHRIDVVLTYDTPRSIVYETLTDQTTKATLTVGYGGMNVAGATGANAFVGFTGSTAPANDAVQTVTNFSYSTSAAAPPIPVSATAPTNSVSGFAGWQYNGNNAGINVPTVSSDNNSLTITTQNGNETDTAFDNTPVTYQTGFNASFLYTDVNGGSPGDGFTFTLQDAPMLGSGGGSAGYGGTIPDSFAVAFNIYDGSQSGIGSDGRINHNQTTGSVNLRSADPINISLAYNPQTLSLTETLTDTVNSNTYTTTYNNIDLSRILRNSPSAYLGITGGTGGGNAQQTITNFSYSTTNVTHAAATTQVNLGADFYQYGIGIDGQSLVGGGLDGTDGLSDTFFTSNGGTSWSRQVTLNNATQTFNFGAPVSGSTSSSNANTLSGAGQIINLPQGQYGNLSWLGMAVDGAQNNQKFTVVYTDGTSQTYVQSLSDWFGGPATGEQIAIPMTYRLDGSGNANPSQKNANIKVFEYNFALDPTKTVASLLMPNNGNVKMLAMNLNAVPTVTAISPKTGGAFTSVTITGTGFSTATVVKFGTVPAASFTINNDGSITAIVPAGSIFGSVDVTVTNIAGTSATGTADEYTYTEPLRWLDPSSQATWNSTAKTLTVTGTAKIIADPGPDEPNIVESGTAARLVIQPATSPTDVHVGGISLSNGAKLQVASVGASRTHSNHNVLVVGTPGAANDPTFAIDGTSTLDLADNDLVLHTGTSDASGTAAYASVFAQAKIGRHGDAATPDGTWNGFGLDSSAANAVSNAQGYEQVALAVADNNQLVFGALSQWSVGSASESLGANDVIVKYTYVGDYALEGMVGDDNAGILQVEYDKGASN
ncbi:MAG TPA: hypothetical protein VGI49_12590, partial [Mycobacterium sp.]